MILRLSNNFVNNFRSKNMSYLVEKVKIERVSCYGVIYLEIGHDVGGVMCGPCDVIDLNLNPNDDEDETVLKISEEFFQSALIDFQRTFERSAVTPEQLRLEIVQGFRRLRENDLDGCSQDSIEITVVPQE